MPELTAPRVIALADQEGGWLAFISTYGGSVYVGQHHTSIKRDHQIQRSDISDAGVLRSERRGGRPCISVCENSWNVGLDEPTIQGRQDTTLLVRQIAPPEISVDNDL